MKEELEKLSKKVDYRDTLIEEFRLEVIKFKHRLSDYDASVKNIYVMHHRMVIGLMVLGFCVIVLSLVK